VWSIVGRRSLLCVRRVGFESHHAAEPPLDSTTTAAVPYLGPMSDRAEQMFDDVSEWLAKELPSACGTDRENVVLEEAVRRFVAARKIVDPEDPYAYATHFFAADGIGFEKKRKPALQRMAELTPDDTQRICNSIGAIAMRLESESLA
jgi:hypothetical protein